MSRRALPLSVRWIAVALAVLGTGAWHSLQAQTNAPILHEPLPPAAAGQGRSDQLEMSRADRSASPAESDAGMPEAILTSQGRIAKPPPAKEGDGVPTYGQRQAPRVGIDRRTGADLELHYQVVFDPTVAPFKRDFSYDRVAADLTLQMSGEGLREIAGTSQPRPDHELFWGHVKLRTQAGKPVLLPSVAPTSQILSWQALPPMPLQFLRDDAGNYAVIAAGDGEVDLRFLMDAPSAYFSAPLAQGRAGRGGEGPKVAALDPDLQQRAMALWPKLGLNPRGDRAEVIGKLVEWFRSFAPAAPEQAGPPLPGTDPLAELVLSQKGVCRHRALGLVILAHSLGIPAHYVMNEAHAFVEVWVPLASGASGWQRVDLGGGAESLELHAAQDKRLHRPLFADPFARPKAYTDQVGRVSVDGQPVDQAFGGAQELKGAEGLRGGASAEPSAGSAQGSADPAADGSGNAGAGGEPADEAAARRQWLRTRAMGLAPKPAPPQLSKSPGKAADMPTEEPRRQATSLRLDALLATAWVGEPIRVSGQLSAGVEAPRLPVEVWLIDPARPSEGRLLGTAPTDAAGRFAAELAVPADALPRTYDVVARFAGDPRRAPCDSGP